MRNRCFFSYLLILGLSFFFNASASSIAVEPLLVSMNYGQRFSDVAVKNIGDTKAYVQVLAEGLKVELGQHGVDVLAAAPGPTETEFAQRANMQVGSAAKAADIAQPILNALGRQATIWPGSLAKLLVYGMAMLPRMMRVRIMGNVMKGMATH